MNDNDENNKQKENEQEVQNSVKENENKNILEEIDKNNNILLNSNLNEQEKDLKNAISQDIPNLNTPIQSQNIPNIQNQKTEESDKGIKVGIIEEQKEKGKEGKSNETKEEKEEKDNLEKNEVEKENNIDKEKINDKEKTVKKEAKNDEKGENESDLFGGDDSYEDQAKITIEKEKNLNKEENINNLNNDTNNIEYKYKEVTQSPPEGINPLNNNYNNMENNVNNYNYVYNQEDQTITPIITIKDFQENPKEKLLINSPYSLKALYDSGYTLDELYYKTFDEFVDEHKEIIHISEEAKMNRFNFYEQLRLDKINNLVKYREKLIKEEQEKEVDMVKLEETIKPMKNIIIDNHIRIAKEEIDVMQKKHEKELANIIELELNKDLFNLEILKQEENYNKEYQKLNFLNLNSNNNENEELENDDQENNNRYNTNANNNINNDFNKDNLNYKSQQNLRSMSSRRKNHLMLNEQNTYLDNLYSLQQAKINQKYEKNQKKNAKKLEKVEKVNKIKAEQMALKKRIEVERAAQNLQKNALDFQMKHENLIKEIQMKKLLIYQNKKKFDNYLKGKKEWNYLKYQEKLDYIARLKRKDENLRQLKYEKLKDKQSQRDKIKFDRIDVYDTKQLKMYYLNNERKRNIIKIKSILDTGVDEDNLQKIISAFPGNKEINKVIQNYKIQREFIKSGGRGVENSKNSQNLGKRPKSQGKLMIRNSSKNKKVEKNELKIPNILTSKKMKNFDINEDKKDVKVYFESEIRDKVKQYKENVYREFFKHVEQEKQNEDKRNNQLKNVHDPKKKHELEKRFSKERAMVDLRLRRENKNIEEKIKYYEYKLRYNNTFFKNK
jgi:hypothetical protein